MKRLFPVFALTTLAAATAAIAQQTPPSAQPPASTSQSQRQATPPDTSKSDKQALMRNCITQTQADHPGAIARDVKDYCKKRVERDTSPQSPRE
jgi:hypothetical protein